MGVDLLQDDQLALLIFEDVEQADGRIAVVGEFEGAGHADIVDLLAGGDGLQRVGQIRQIVLRRARGSSHPGYGRRWRPDPPTCRPRRRGSRASSNRSCWRRASNARPRRPSARGNRTACRTSVPIGVPPRVPRAPSMAWGGMLLGTVEKASASATKALVGSNLPVRTRAAPELGVGIGVIDDHIGVGIVGDDLAGLGIEGRLGRVEDHRSLDLAALGFPSRGEALRQAARHRARCDRRRRPACPRRCRACRRSPRPGPAPAGCPAARCGRWCLRP